MKVSAAYRVKWLNKEIERLQDLLDRVAEDNAELRASNKALRSKVNRLQIRLRGELPGDPCDDPVTGDDSWMFDMDDSR
jgi:chromosome segregation ATPase